MLSARAEQVSLLSVCALCAGQTWQRGRGRLVVTFTPDGRAVLRLEDGTARGNWLEMSPEDVAWLAGVLAVCARQVKRKVSAKLAKGEGMFQQETIQRTWIVSASTALRINALAESLGVSPSSVVDRLLVHGLEAAEAGELALSVRPVRYALVQDG